VCPAETCPECTGCALPPAFAFALERLLPLTQPIRHGSRDGVAVQFGAMRLLHIRGNGPCRSHITSAASTARLLSYNPPSGQSKACWTRAIQATQARHRQKPFLAIQVQACCRPKSMDRRPAIRTPWTSRRWMRAQPRGGNCRALLSRSIGRRSRDVCRAAHHVAKPEFSSGLESASMSALPGAINQNQSKRCGPAGSRDVRMNVRFSG